MSISTDLVQRLPSIIRLKWFAILTVIIFVYGSCVQGTLTETNPTSQYRPNDNYYSSNLDGDYLDFIERAAPRLGRAAPRLGRASPRLVRHITALLFSRLNHPGRYDTYENDETMNEYSNDADFATHERRAAPRLGRSI